MAIQAGEKYTGERPLGIYQGKPSINTRKLVVEEGGFLYDSDAYNDDLPYRNYDFNRPHLVIPYTLDMNDMKFVAINGSFSNGNEFFDYLKDSFDQLYQEGCKGKPKMMTIGLHGRVVGKPGRARGLQKFLDYILAFKDIWICRRVDIARHWHKVHPPQNNLIKSNL